ncbi:hypothetical protein CEXT_66731 [Caerostris extrusa]|uniref:Uncharacterized protein n=1 Tax=Caerostris extrusa TaxID=172846 RepID=A0AAV4PFH0_CAEEX|nr:hypothetical protein CEXT_66731 [Caerostris extrusa]
MSHLSNSTVNLRYTSIFTKTRNGSSTSLHFFFTMSSLQKKKVSNKLFWQYPLRDYYDDSRETASSLAKRKKSWIIRKKKIAVCATGSVISDANFSGT